MGVEFLALLPPGRRLVVELEPIPGGTETYPLEVSVDVGAIPVGTIVIDAEAERSVGTFTVPEPAAATPFEVRLRAADWWIAPIVGGACPISARVARLASLED
jgi:hypothetical protein